jgi:hypothetical protein
MLSVIQNVCWRAPSEGTAASVASAAGSLGDASEPDVHRVFISYKRSAEPDTSLASFLYEALTKRGHRVFKDVDNIPVGEEFEELIGGAITGSDFFIVLLTKPAMRGRWVIAETEMAVDSHTHTGHPKILPVRADTAALGLRFRAAIGDLNYFEWRHVKDNDGLLAAILESMAQRPEPPTPQPGTEPTSPGPPKPLDVVLLHPPPPDYAPLSDKGQSLTGEHVIGQSLWQSDRARQVLGGTMIVGVVAGEETSLSATRATGPGFFRIRILKDRRVQSRPAEFIRMMQGDTHDWGFARHSVDGSVLLGTPSGSDKPIAVSFDTAIVKAAWTIVHRRSTAEEKFLIVMKDSQA